MFIEQVISPDWQLKYNNEGYDRASDMMQPVTTPMFITTNL
jgi:hypothetical protein